MKMSWDHVLIKELESKTKMIMPDVQARVPNKGEVVAVGPGDYYGYYQFVPTKVKAGEKVYFIRDRAIEVELKGEKYYVIKEREVLGVITDEEAKD